MLSMASGYLMEGLVNFFFRGTARIDRSACGKDQDHLRVEMRSTARPIFFLDGDLVRDAVEVVPTARFLRVSALRKSNSANSILLNLGVI